MIDAEGDGREQILLPRRGGIVSDGGERVAIVGWDPTDGPLEVACHCCTSPLPAVVVSTGMKRECQQNDSLADGHVEVVIPHGGE